MKKWSFDVSFAQESFKNALILKILVSMDRAQPGELAKKHFCRCWMYISLLIHSEDEKLVKIANFSMSTCIVMIVKLNIELLDSLICILGRKCFTKTRQREAKKS